MENGRSQRNAWKKNKKRNRNRKRGCQVFGDDSGGPSTSNQSSDHNDSWSMEASDIPGYSYDPQTKKYFKILPDAPGQPRNSTASDFRAKQQEENRVQRIAAPKKTSSSLSLLNSLVKRQLGFGHNGMLQRQIFEKRLSNVVTQLTMENPPDFIFDESAGGLGGVYPKRCRFLEVSEDGTKLICSLGLLRSPNFVNAEPSNVGILKPYYRAAEKESITFANDEVHSTYLRGHVSSEFRVLDFLNQSCLLYAEQDVASDGSGGISTSAKFRTVTSLADPMNPNRGMGIDVPLVENHDPTEKFVSQVTLHNHKSRIAYALGGRFNHAVYTDLTGNDPLEYTPFFKDNNVFASNPILALEFDESGDVAYLGSKRGGFSAYDLRTHTVNKSSCIFESKRAISFIRTLKRTANEVVTCCWNGEAKLWDVRSSKAAIHTMNSDKDTYFSLPCYVDHNERFLFSTAIDGSVRGWSLQTGRKICELACPWTVNDVKTDLPRIVYAENWVGRGEHSALVLAGRNQFNSFEVPLNTT